MSIVSFLSRKYHAMNECLPVTFAIDISTGKPFIFNLVVDGRAAVEYCSNYYNRRMRFSAFSFSCEATERFSSID